MSLKTQAKRARSMTRCSRQWVAPSPRARDAFLIASTNKGPGRRRSRAATFARNSSNRLNVVPFLCRRCARQRGYSAAGTRVSGGVRPAVRKAADRIGEEALEVLSRYGWPGNVRELRNVIERVLILNPRVLRIDASTCLRHPDRVREARKTSPRCSRLATPTSATISRRSSRRRAHISSRAAEMLNQKPAFSCVFFTGETLVRAVMSSALRQWLYFRASLFAGYPHIPLRLKAQPEFWIGIECFREAQCHIRGEWMLSFKTRDSAGRGDPRCLVTPNAFEQ